MFEFKIQVWKKKVANKMLSVPNSAIELLILFNKKTTYSSLW